jgi:hypothetical protein
MCKGGWRGRVFREYLSLDGGRPTRLGFKHRALLTNSVNFTSNLRDSCLCALNYVEVCP